MHISYKYFNGFEKYVIGKGNTFLILYNIIF